MTKNPNDTPTFEQQHKASRELGRGKKLDAHATLEATREDLILTARRAMLVILLEQSRCTADDVHEAIEIPGRVDPTCLGAVPGPLARGGIIAANGYEDSRRPIAHGRPVKVWTLHDAEKARAWLASQPAPDMQSTGDTAEERHSLEDPPCELQRDLFDLDAESATEGGL